MAILLEPTVKPPPPSQKVFQSRIQGRYITVSVHQLAMAWWCFKAGHINKRQLRIYFAAWEMLEKRHYTQKDLDGGGAREPLYTLKEIRRFCGWLALKKGRYDALRRN